MKNSEKKVHHIYTSCDRMICEDGTSYSTNIIIEKNDGEVIDWSIDTPHDLKKAEFDKVKTITDFYAVLEEMDSLFENPEGYHENILGINDISEIVSIIVEVTEEYNDYDEEDVCLYEYFDTGRVGYDFVNNKKHINEVSSPFITLNEMIDKLTEYAENSGFKDYYNKAIKGKTEEEIKRLYLEVFGK